MQNNDTYESVLFFGYIEFQWDILYVYTSTVAILRGLFRVFTRRHWMADSGVISHERETSSGSTISILVIFGFIIAEKSCHRLT